MNKSLRNIEFKTNGDFFLKIKRTNPDKEFTLMPGVVNLTKVEAISLYKYIKGLLDDY